MLADDVVTKAIRDDLPRLMGRFEGFSESVAPRLVAVERDLKKVLADMEARHERSIQLTISLRWRGRRFDRHAHG